VLQLKGSVRQTVRTVREQEQGSERTVSVRRQRVAGRRVERHPMVEESTVTLSLLMQALLETRTGRKQRTYL
jgi:hypothetical protein